MTTVIMIVLLVGLFYFMYRSNKKQEREAAQMRNNLEIGDEVTTIGGIIGEIVRIKDETVTIETGKDRTKIRILRSAIRSVDVHAYEKRGETKPADTAQQNANPMHEPVKKKKKKKKGAQVEEAVVETQANTENVENSDVDEAVEAVEIAESVEAEEPKAE